MKEKYSKPCPVIAIILILICCCLLAGCNQQDEQPDYPSLWIGSNGRYNLYGPNNHEYQLVIYDVNYGIETLDTNGNSMLPTISNNGFILMMDIEDLSNITKGDIVVFTKDGMTISHRVIDIGWDWNGRYFITKGDNCEKDDGKIRDGQIKGVVVGIFY